MHSKRAGILAPQASGRLYLARVVLAVLTLFDMDLMGRVPVPTAWLRRAPI